MSRRSTGWTLLGLALAGAALVAALGVRDGGVDGWLVALTVLGVAGGVTTVVLDRRALARRAAELGGASGGRRSDRWAGPRGRLDG
ncbi:hypothetical protein [Actinotalea sp. Marseille-Q4924]|uniref:hypothetical protein n=1 Tax=Actinotalea sp. Marseille-Q4924 TaxID=2866571 RepID=UPI001CE3CAE9|nr:hypothetical protein [Actinotalea sp. Marseille-Q4924]